VYPSIENKRTKLNASGAYTSSSNQDTDEASAKVHRRPIGQKAAKAKKRERESIITLFRRLPVK
jgi:hypothetical protein